jgi:hypothetical protein
MELPTLHLKRAALIKYHVTFIHEIIVVGVNSSMVFRQA